MPGWAPGAQLLIDATTARESVNRFWEEKHVLDGVGTALRDKLPAMQQPQGGRRLIVTEKGAIIAVDFINRAVLLLEPVPGSADLQWRCSGTPHTSMPPNCQK